MRAVRRFARLLLDHCVPAACSQWVYKAWYRRRLDAAYSRLDRRTTFESIYQNNVWGGSALSQYYSGDGSHEEGVVAPYIVAVNAWLNSQPRRLNVVDLGCGDFSIGAQLRAACGKYTACDIAESVVEFNRAKFKALDVEFRCLDMVTDDLPPGDAVFIRQVLQHLSNTEIARVVTKLVGRYRYLILTEHVPPSHFVPNLNKTTGPNIRLLFESGVVLTAPPFNLHVVSQRELCEVGQHGGRIQTLLYELPFATT
jgi:ribosomal protein L11 methylase PrmA